ncbi:Uncharacterised protein [Vibrio cholerae]|nr:Uncharacterised protein [Vibrio cholerae]
MPNKQLVLLLRLAIRRNKSDQQLLLFSHQTCCLKMTGLQKVAIS